MGKPVSPNQFLNLIHQAVKLRVASCGSEISGVSIGRPLNNWQIEQHLKDKWHEVDGRRADHCTVCDNWYAAEEPGGSVGITTLDIPGIQICVLCQMATCELVFAHLR